MACCRCCCGGVDCAEGDEGKCCCGGGSGACCQEGEYCCSGVCKPDPCCDEDADCDYFWVLGLSLGPPCDAPEYCATYWFNSQDDAQDFGDQLIADGCGAVNIIAGQGICCDGQCFPKEEDLPYCEPIGGIECP